METFLAPIEKPQSLLMRLVYYFSRKRFGKVLTPLKVVAARMPLAFGMFSGKIAQLDRKMSLPPESLMLVREQVAHINVCLFCIDIGRSFTIQQRFNQEKFDALEHYQSSPLFNEKERAMLDFVTKLARERKMDEATFNRLRPHFTERQICEIVWAVSTEFYYNMGNIALNIHSDMLCDIAKKRE